MILKLSLGFLGCGSYSSDWLTYWKRVVLKSCWLVFFDAELLSSWLFMLLISCKLIGFCFYIPSRFSCLLFVKNLKESKECIFVILGVDLRFL